MTEYSPYFATAYHQGISQRDKIALKMLPYAREDRKTMNEAMLRVMFGDKLPRSYWPHEVDMMLAYKYADAMMIEGNKK